MATELNGINGGLALEPDMSNLTLRHQPVEAKKPSGHSNGATSGSKYRFDRKWETMTEMPVPSN